MRFFKKLIGPFIVSAAVILVTVGIYAQTPPYTCANGQFVNAILTNVGSSCSSQVQSDWNATSAPAQILNEPVLAAVATSGSYTDLSNTPTVTPRSFNNAPTHPIQTVAAAANGFQLSSTRDTHVSYTPSVTTTATIGGSGSGYVVLEISPTNSTSAASWTAIAELSNTQTISLAVALNSVQTNTSALTGIVPAGYYARLRSVISSGTVTFAYLMGQEVLL